MSGETSHALASSNDIQVTIMRYEDHEIYEKLKEALSRGKRAALATVIAHPESDVLGAKALYIYDESRFVAAESFPIKWHAWTEHRCRNLIGGGQERVAVDSPENSPRVRVALEVFAPAPRLIIAGGGHIAQPTCAIASIVGFDVTVIDDRPSFANRERFPSASRVICDNFASGLAAADVDDSCAVVVVTRGHLHDLQVLTALLDTRPRYLGVIGSKRRVATVLEKLREQGASEEFIDGLYAPIGLDIGADSPEEIGLAIVAEVVCVLRGGKGGHLAWRPGKGRVANEPLAR